MEYLIPVSWQMYGHVSVEADTPQKAAEIAETDENIALPSGTYVEASWEVDWPVVEGRIVKKGGE